MIHLLFFAFLLNYLSSSFKTAFLNKHSAYTSMRHVHLGAIK
jgi:hypothetical protein